MVCPILASWKCFEYRVLNTLTHFNVFFKLYQAHIWFRGIDWDRIYQMEAAFIPEVNDELDTQNFEKFEEVPNIIVLCIV